MVELAHSYLIDYLTNKKAELAETLFDDQIVHKDVVGAAAGGRLVCKGQSPACLTCPTCFAA
jgi:adenine-specific DNA glycosylase